MTCHSTGNFSEAKFGGNDREVAIPHPDLQKYYLQTLQKHQSDFSEFQITIEATHHGPTALTKPTIFTLPEGVAILVVVIEIFLA